MGDRRTAFGDIAKAIGGAAALAGIWAEFSVNNESELVAGLTNPAGGNFRGKFKGQSFTPGKGMRDNMSFDELTAGLSNPAGENFRGKFKGQSFTPGKGMRNRSSFDEIC